mgnify:CR=1 FL=1
MSKYQVEDLKAPEFQLIDQLQHNDLMPFIKKAYEQRNTIYYCYNGLTIVFMIVLFTLMLKEVVRGELRFSTEFIYFSYGILATFTLIPLHEYIHAVAYKYVGAKKTSYDMNLRKFYFMAMADKFVVNSREFRIVVLAPFITISIGCVILFIFLPGMWKFAAFGLFFTHSMFCSGDFGFLSYLNNHKTKDIYTYDDKEKGESYFFERVED